MMPARIIPELTRVDSLELAGIGYNEKTSNMTILFQHGRAYEYFQVPHAEYQALLYSNDRAEHFHNNIDGRFQSKRVA
jgi:hypothetical protein